MKRVLLMTVAGLVVASAAMAANENARFAMHYKVKQLKNPLPLCDDLSTSTLEVNYSPQGVDCRDFVVTTTTSNAANIYVVAGQGDGGIAGISFGVDYDGRVAGQKISPGLVTWSACANGIQFPNQPQPPNVSFGVFPKPKGGLRITWNTADNGCIQDVVGAGIQAIAGAFYSYAYTADTMKLTPNNNLDTGPELAVTDCTGNTTDLLQIFPADVQHLLTGRVAFGAGGTFGPGYTPCGVTATVPSTWGNIKNLYSNTD